MLSLEDRLLDIRLRIARLARVAPAIIVKVSDAVRAAQQHVRTALGAIDNSSSLSIPHQQVLCDGASVLHSGEAMDVELMDLARQVHAYSKEMQSSMGAIVGEARPSEWATVGRNFQSMVDVELHEHRCRQAACRFVDPEVFLDPPEWGRL